MKVESRSQKNLIPRLPDCEMRMILRSLVFTQY